ncbi:MAG: glycosyltransferase family 4 protein [Desulfocucumaceae bacterium]
MQLVWKARFFDITGYSAAARGYVLSLDRIGANVKVILEGKGTPQAIPGKAVDRICRLAGKPFERPSNTIFIRQSIPDKFERYGSFSMGITAWEADKVHPLWRDWCNAMDAVGVPSSMNLGAFTGGGVHKPVELIRYGVDEYFIRPGEYQDPFYGKKVPPFKFLSVFDWIYRKGYDLLVRAFWEEFARGDGVCLVVKTGSGRPFVGARENIMSDMRRLKEAYRPGWDSAPVIFFTGDTHPASMVNLYRSCNCFVLPSRGEGLGLPLLEAGSLGMPVIATGWGGQSDFLDSENSFPVEYEMDRVPYQRHCPYYGPDQRWATPSVKDLRKKMRWVLENYRASTEKGEKLRDRVLSEYTWQNAAMNAVDVISRLGGREIV